MVTLTLSCHDLVLRSVRESLGQVSRSALKKRPCFAAIAVGQTADAFKLYQHSAQLEDL